MVEVKKCRTCGQILTVDLNGDLFCMQGVIMEENHDDYYPPEKTITFNLDEFTTWLDDLIDVDWQQCGPWDTITSYYELDEEGNLHWCLKWDRTNKYHSDDDEHEQKRMEIALKGDISR